MSNMVGRLLTAVALSFPFALSAQAGGPKTPSDTILRLPELNVTATRSPRSTFNTPQPVTVIDSTTIRRSMANNAADLLRMTPGVDVIGVGPNQTRISIRGQRGHRILLLEDGVRLNNSRRQQDFGEIPSLVGVNDLERVEVVRGPSSVLYGTDAIGGVLNMVTGRAPAGKTGTAVQGRVGYRYSGVGDLQEGSGSVTGNLGAFGFSLGAQYRDAGSYTAPSGTFGNIRLANTTRVEDSGVQDENYRAEIGYGRSGTDRVYLRYTRYLASDAGFGFVDPRAFGDSAGGRIRLFFPNQDVERISVGYQNYSPGVSFADRVDLTLYTMLNQRDFSQDIVVPLGPTARLTSGGNNFTNTRTNGFRLEAAKGVGRHVLTYGADFFRDATDSRDSSVTTVTGFGPPSSSVNTLPTVPRATYRSVGFFVQDEWRLMPRVDLVLGGRYQRVTAKTLPTEGLSDPLANSSDNALVGAANLGVAVTPELRLVGSVGRAFRSANLIERFFDGAAEGSGVQIPNPDLDPETSFNIDGGFKYARGVFYAEGLYFRNEISDGIRAAATGDEVNGQPVFQNVNVEKLRETGIEMLADVRLLSGIRFGGSYTHFNSTNVSDDGSPVGDGFSTKLTGQVGYRDPQDRFSAGYEIRYIGTRKDVAITGSPVGDELPSFTVSNLRGSVQLLQTTGTTHRIDIALNNVFDVLYAEFPNAGFFRPEPGRQLSVSYSLGF